jgi:hypothetical protein
MRALMTQASLLSIRKSGRPGFSVLREKVAPEALLVTASQNWTEVLSFAATRVLP